MKRLTASVIGSLLGLIGWWCIEARQRLEDWAHGTESDEFKVGGTD